jgi:hypothetical protein
VRVLFSFFFFPFFSLLLESVHCAFDSEESVHCAFDNEHEGKRSHVMS